MSVDMQARSRGKIYNDKQQVNRSTRPNQTNQKHEGRKDCSQRLFIQAAVCMRCTHGLRDLLVLEALEVAMLVHAVHHRPALRFHPALGHEVQLRVHVHSLHLGVVVVVGGEAGVA